MPASLVLLKQPDAHRLWVLVAGLLVASVVLLFASLQLPWYTATYAVTELEARGTFDFREAVLVVEYQGTPLRDPFRTSYGDGSPFGALMGRTEVFVAAGVIGAVAVAGLAYLHRSGRYSSPGLIKASWILGTGGLTAGLVYFTMNAASAGAEEVFVQISTLASLQGQPGPAFPPAPRFWGTQNYYNGDLQSAPGAGWLLAILGLVNLVLATLLLYRFPAADPTGEQVAADFRVERPEAAPATPLARENPALGREM